MSKNKKKVINITEQMNEEPPKIIWGDKEFEVDDSYLNMLRFDELDLQSKEGMEEVLEMTLGEGHGIELISLKGTQVKALMIAIIAALRGEDYDVVEAQFRF